MAHMRNATTKWEIFNSLDVTSEGEMFHENQIKRERKFTKAIRKQEQKLKGNKRVMNIDGSFNAYDIIKECETELEKLNNNKMSYNAAKKAGILWTPEQKAASKEAKRIARKEKRLANK